MQSVPVSGDCLNILTRMLVASPAERLSMDLIKQHPWFKAGLPPGALDMNEFLLRGMEPLNLSMVRRLCPGRPHSRVALLRPLGPGTWPAHLPASLQGRQSAGLLRAGRAGEGVLARAGGAERGPHPGEGAAGGLPGGERGVLPHMSAQPLSGRMAVPSGTVWRRGGAFSVPDRALLWRRRCRGLTGRPAGALAACVSSPRAQHWCSNRSLGRRPRRVRTNSPQQSPLQQQLCAFMPPQQLFHAPAAGRGGV